MWSKIIYKTDNQLIHDSSYESGNYEEIFTLPISEGLYTDFQQLKSQETDYSHILKDVKLFLYNFTSAIPEKFLRLNLLIRPYEDFCRTCIITDNEILSLVNMDVDRFCNEMIPAGSKEKHLSKIKGKNPLQQRSSVEINKQWKRVLSELNYLIPAQFKKLGYELIRREEVAEIDMVTVRRLARAIHSRYLNEVRYHNGPELNSIFYNPGNSLNEYPENFDDLTREIKNSNTDNAVHIPTKLLSIGYKIRQVKKDFKPAALHLDDLEIETMARLEHVRWSWEKRLNGWTYGIIKDEFKKKHPSLTAYENLSESEKEKDRQLVKLIPGLLQDIKYEAFPVSPNRISKLSYIIKPQSSIHRILTETRELNDHIRKLVQLTPLVDNMVRIRNSKIEEAIIEVEQSYRYAQHIQETFLPDDLYIRECFPESFILFKPKDIVSGDFYFFSKKENQIIFAVADCTGHGIPGALLSTLGYGILDQAVNEIKLTDPPSILHHLYSRIHRFLRNDESGTGMSDDMDIALCILDSKTNLLTYAGVHNPLYHISRGELNVYRAKNFLAECLRDGDCNFNSEKIQLESGDTIYLCSDGYADQFGGQLHRRYLSGRFKSFLLSIKDYPMPEQSDMLYEEIEKWREEKNEGQTDDILVIGIKI